jgi:hypothetical protein
MLYVLLAEKLTWKRYQCCHGESVNASFEHLQMLVPELRLDFPPGTAFFCTKQTMTGSSNVEEWLRQQGWQPPRAIEIFMQQHNATTIAIE